MVIKFLLYLVHPTLSLLQFQPDTPLCGSNIIGNAWATIQTPMDKWHPHLTLQPSTTPVAFPMDGSENRGDVDIRFTRVLNTYSWCSRRAHLLKHVPHLTNERQRPF
jgi:hypothetical protein